MSRSSFVQWMRAQQLEVLDHSRVLYVRGERLGKCQSEQYVRCERRSTRTILSPDVRLTLNH